MRAGARLMRFHFTYRNTAVTIFLWDNWAMPTIHTTFQWRHIQQRFRYSSLCLGSGFKGVYGTVPTGQQLWNICDQSIVFEWIHVLHRNQYKHYKDRKWSKVLQYLVLEKKSCFSKHTVLRAGRAAQSYLWHCMSNIVLFVHDVEIIRCS